MVHMTSVAFDVGFGGDIIDLVGSQLYILTKTLLQFALDHFSDVVKVAGAGSEMRWLPILTAWTFDQP